MEHSPEISELFTALAGVQGELKVAKRTQRAEVATKKGNDYAYTYTSLAEVWEIIRQPLSQAGLFVLQLPTADSDGVSVRTVLAHTSGQWLAETLRLPLAEGTAQSIGSGITYARRYSLMSILGIPAEDDDGKAATEHAQQQSGASPTLGPLADYAIGMGWKGRLIADAETEALQDYADRLRTEAEKPQNKYAAKNRRELAQVEIELAARRKQEPRQRAQQPRRPVDADDIVTSGPLKAQPIQQVNNHDALMAYGVMVQEHVDTLRKRGESERADNAQAHLRKVEARLDELRNQQMEKTDAKN